MPDRTGIEWTDATWNPVRGCSRVSEGCRRCYAERVAARFSGPGRPFRGFATGRGTASRWTGRVEIVPNMMDTPLRWVRPRRVFVNSMSDLFHEELADHDIDRVFGVMWAALYRRDGGPGHVFQILTKRAGRMRDYMAQDRREAWARWAAHHVASEAADTIHDGVMGFVGPHPRIWAGVSVEDDDAARQRLPALRDVPAVVRFVSAEPLLGPLDLEPYLTRFDRCDAEDGEPLGCVGCDGMGGDECSATRAPVIHWVIAGGESGAGARPMAADWMRGVRDACARAGTAFFAKQMGGADKARMPPIPDDLLIRQFPAGAEP